MTKWPNSISTAAFQAASVTATTAAPSSEITTTNILPNMKSSLLLSLCAATLTGVIAHPQDPQIVIQESQQTLVEPDEYLIELAPSETRWITEDEKWALRRV